MKRAIIFIHGFLTNSGDFGELFDFLGDRYEKVVKCLLPGHSENNTPDYSQFTAEATFDYVLKTYDELAEEYEHIDLVGVSMGGALSTYLMSVRKIEKAVLLAPANKFLNPKLPREYVRYLLQAMRGALDEKAANFREMRQKVDKALETVNNNSKIGADFLSKELLPYYNARNFSTLAKIVDRCNSSITEIKTPTLIIWGKLDEMVREESVDYVYSACVNKNSKIIKLTDIGHLLMLAVNCRQITDEVIKYLYDDSIV